jgi:tetratricopeptide (TPR) repeat protein
LHARASHKWPATIDTFHPFSAPPGQQGLYFEALGSFQEAEELYKKELEKDPANGLMLKRMVRPP